MSVIEIVISVLLFILVGSFFAFLNTYLGYILPTFIIVFINIVLGILIVKFIIGRQNG